MNSVPQRAGQYWSPGMPKHHCMRLVTQILKATHIASFSLSSLNYGTIFFTSFVRGTIVLRKIRIVLSSFEQEEREWVDMSVRHICGFVLQGEATMLHRLPLQFQAFFLSWWMWLHTFVKLYKPCPGEKLRVPTQPQPLGSCLSIPRLLPTAAQWPWGDPLGHW